MQGGVYSDQKCPICGGSFKYNGRGALTCPKHKGQAASRFIVKYPSGKKQKPIQKRYDNYQDAEEHLTAMRYHTNQGAFDPRDWTSAPVLGFETLTRKWLDKKQGDVTTKTWKIYTDYMERAIATWGDRNVKGIRYADIQDFLDSLDLGAKSKANVNACLHSFWTWMKKQEYVTSEHFPTFPEVKFKLGRRKTVTKEVQGEILDEIFRQTHQINPKIWLGVNWLSTYVCLRPGDLPRIRECDIDLGNRTILIRDPKASEPYEMPLTDDDVRILRDLPRGVGELPFFRHAPSASWSQGRPFGQKYWYKWWKKACESLGIKGVDLYGGTRHSSVTAMRRTHTPEQIRGATMHRTNAAFERYYSVDSEDLREMYERVQNVLRDGVYRPEKYKPPRCTARVPPKSRVKKSQVVELKRK